VAELHVDAAPQLLSDELKETLKEDYGIRVISAAPKHQRQNGTPERRWQTARQVAFKLMTHARVGLPFFDTALQQAALICNVVPVRGAFRPGTDIPAVPFMRHYNAEPRLGVPCCCQGIPPQGCTGRILKDHNMIQRGVRGIYVGFPIDQANYLIWIPSAQQFAVSADVAFDEDFSSTLAYEGRLYHDSLPFCTTNDAPHNSLSPLAWTGPPVTSADPANPDDPWTPSTIFPPTHQPNDPMDWTPRHVDFFVPPIPETNDTGGAEQGDVFPENDVEQGPVETGTTADFEEGP